MGAFRPPAIVAIVFSIIIGLAAVYLVLQMRGEPVLPVSPATKASASCQPGVNGTDYWIMGDNELSAMFSSQQSAMSYGVKEANLFYRENGGSTKVSNIPDSMTLADYKSYAQFQRDIQAGVIKPGIHWVMYDNEQWAATPDNEKQDPLAFEQEFASLAHSHGYKVILAPAQDLVPGFDRTAFQNGTSYAQQFVHYFAPVTAKYADIWSVQAQPYELDIYRASNSYPSLVSAAFKAATQANSQIVLFAGLSTNRVDNAIQMYKDWDASRSLVEGYWLNIPDYTSSGPTTLAANFLTMLPATAAASAQTCHKVGG